MLVDPVALLPTRELGQNTIVDQAMRRFLRMVPEAREPGRQRPRRGPAHRASLVTVLSAETGRDLSRDLSWREVFGPAGVGDKMSAQLVADGACWGMLHLHRDRSSRYYSQEDAEFVSEVAPLLARGLQVGLRTLRRHDGPALEPGTIIVDRDMSLVAATEEAWRWIDRLGLPPQNDVEPFPAVIYVVAANVAASTERRPRPAQVRLQAADGRWMTVRAAPLTSWSHAAAGCAITLEPARPEALAPLLMRAWGLTPRERQVAQLVIDGLSSEDVAKALVISVHTVRGHLKTIFDKIGVTRRQELVAVLTAGTPQPHREVIVQRRSRVRVAPTARAAGPARRRRLSMPRLKYARLIRPATSSSSKLASSCGSGAGTGTIVAGGERQFDVTACVSDLVTIWPS
jgi:DNA-binding CsgD family transcriptional regulator